MTVISISLALMAGLAWAEEPASVNCYEFEVPSPATLASAEQIESKETWCYWKRPEANETVLFHVDDGQVKAETTAALFSNGSLSLATLVKGELSYYTLEDPMSPFNAPLKEPENKTPLKGVATAEVLKNVERLAKDLDQAPKTFVPLTLRPGRYQASVPSSSLPWRGYWWPFNRRELAGGANSPMAKYDQFVTARTGRNPGAQSWELRNHGAGDDWYGHCNGWAAASILRSEPRGPRYDSRTGIVFSVSDQKGLWVEKDNCVQSRFIGRRNNGSPGDNARDIHPALFHKTLTTHIGHMGKPVLMDYDPTLVVFHNVISGYQMQIRRLSRRGVHVRAVVRTHKFDDGPYNQVGPAQAFNRVYEYQLFIDRNGKVGGGRWLSDNPDFLWIPISPSNCGSTNPAVETRWIEEIVSGLPRGR